jgi:hypothetical protein
MVVFGTVVSIVMFIDEGKEVSLERFVAIAVIVCGPSNNADVVNDHDVLPLARAYKPLSTLTSTFSMPEPVSDAVPLTATVVVFSIAPSYGEDIITVGAPEAVPNPKEKKIIKTTESIIVFFPLLINYLPAN